MTPAGTSRTGPTSTPSSSRGSTTATYITGARSIPTSIRGESLTLWAGAHGWSLRSRTLGSTRPCRPTLGSIAATGDGNSGTGQLTCRLTTDPDDDAPLAVGKD